jgi:BexC/CtrB/KpsE family polysaccharide export inner-membrane protein
MTKPNLTYLGPVAGREDPNAVSGRDWWRRLPVAFLVVVVVPTLIAALYFFLIATPRYVSEARFIVRAPSHNQPSSLGIALQGVGLSSTQTDSFAVHEYIRSGDGLRELMTQVDVARIYGNRGADFFSRLPHPWAGHSFDDLYSGFRQYVTIGYDSTTGISTIRVEAFRADDARLINERLLGGGERLVNRLNERAVSDAVSQGERTVEEAQLRLTRSQQELTTFRNRERFIDPSRTANAGAALIGELAVNLATLKAERAQMAASAPQSPQLPFLDGRIRALQAQIDIEQQKIVGDSDSLAPKIGAYEELVLNRELADRALATAMTSLDAAKLDARRQQLYLERVVDPSLASEPSKPRRLLAVLAVLATCFMAYGTGWLIWAGVRESKQD